MSHTCYRLQLRFLIKAERLQMLQNKIEHRIIKYHKNGRQKICQAFLVFGVFQGQVGTFYIKRERQILNADQSRYAAGDMPKYFLNSLLKLPGSV